MSKFDADTLRALRDTEEVTIRTDKHPETAVVIWVVVADGEVFMRSARGAKGGGPGTSPRAARPRWRLPAAGWRCRRCRRPTKPRSRAPAANI